MEGARPRRVPPSWPRVALRPTPARLGTVAVAMATAACSGSDFVEPRPPELTPDSVADASTPLSLISVPLDIPLQPLVRLVERAVPVRYGDLEEFHESSDSGRAAVAFVLERAPFEATLVKDVARLTTTVLYRLRVRYDLPAMPDVGGSCGLNVARPPALTVTLESPISLAEDWSLRTRTRIAELRPATGDEVDRCQVTMLGLDITERVVQEARGFLEDHLAEIDSLMSRVDTRGRFVDWWATLLRPVQLSDSIWLAMGPEAIRRGPIRGAGDRLSVDLALVSRPRIVYGARPGILPIPLPPLDSGDVEPRLELVVDARAEYEAATGLLTEQVAGRSIDMDGRSVRVDSLRVYGIGSGRLAMEARVSGDVRGRLYLTGRPTVDATTGRLSVPDLDLDIASRDLVTSVYSWFAAPALRSYLRERATWPTQSAVEFLTLWLRRGLNRDLSDDLGVAGVVDSLAIVGVSARRDALHVRVTAYGSATLFVTR